MLIWSQFTRTVIGLVHAMDRGGLVRGRMSPSVDLRQLIGKQAAVCSALSSTEAEYYGAVQSAKIALHMRVLLFEMQFGKLRNANDEQNLPAMRVFMDNMSAIAQAENVEIKNAANYI